MAIDRNKVAEAAQKFSLKGQYTKAIAELQKIVAEDNNDVRTLQRIAEMREQSPSVAVLAAVEGASSDTLDAVLDAGAFDFVTKPFNIEELLLAIERALRHHALQDEVKRLGVQTPWRLTFSYGRALQSATLKVGFGI